MKSIERIEWKYILSLGTFFLICLIAWDRNVHLRIESKILDQIDESILQNEKESNSFYDRVNIKQAETTEGLLNGAQSLSNKRDEMSNRLEEFHKEMKQGSKKMSNELYDRFKNGWANIDKDLNENSSSNIAAIKKD